MGTILQIVTKPNDAFANAVIDEEQKRAGTVLREFNLTESAPDYDRLLEEIFRAEAIHVW